MSPDQMNMTEMFKIFNMMSVSITATDVTTQTLINITERRNFTPGHYWNTSVYTGNNEIEPTLTMDTDTKGMNTGVLTGFFILVILTISANVLVMIVTAKDPKLRIKSNLYIFSLALVDAVVGLTVMTPFAIYNIFGHWPLGVDLCTLWTCLDFSFCSISMLHLLLIAFDRIECIEKPFSYVGHPTKRPTLVRIVSAWILGFIVWVPAVVYFHHKSKLDGQIVVTDCLFVPAKEYILVQSILVYYGPILAMLVLYIELLAALKRKQRRRIQYNAKNTEAQNGVHNEAFEIQECVEDGRHRTSKAHTQKAHASQFTEAKQRRMARQNNRSVRVIGVIIFVFLLCWIPFCVFWPVAAFCPGCIPPELYEASYLLTYLNSLVNPLLYFCVNRDFRKALLRLCGCRCQIGSLVCKTPEHRSHCN